MLLSIKLKKFIALTLMLLLSACSNNSTGTSNTGDNVNLDNVDSSATTTDSYDYLNQLRNNAGMISLDKNEKLEQSATNHANYLITNNLVGHEETSGNTGFTGKTAANRAVAAGYNSYIVGEGIATGESAKQAIDSLFSAIYHRFTLLDFEYDEIGMALLNKDVDKNIFVHNIGNEELD